MEEIECIIVGGPQHGLVLRHLWDKRRLPQLVVTTDDGQPCSAAVQRRDDGIGIRCLLLHPQATGEQILTMLAT